MEDGGFYYLNQGCSSPAFPSGLVLLWMEEIYNLISKFKYYKTNPNIKNQKVNVLATILRNPFDWLYFMGGGWRYLMPMSSLFFSGITLWIGFTKDGG
jgi:hypothetical protein